MSLKKLYLLGFNLVSASGWGYVLFNTASALASGATPDQLWSKFGSTLILVQSLALLEVVHAKIKLVPSPVLTTLIQVSSRLLLAWAVSPNSVSAQNHWSLGLMMCSWALVEVPRYLFYALNLYLDNVPFPLFWLRYSLFAILYPTGITGELGQILSAMGDFKKSSLALWYLLFVVVILYVPGSPFMYYHMIGQRKRAFEKVKSQASTPATTQTFDGLEFPIEAATGQPSSTILNKGAMAASVKAIKPEAAKRVEDERNWRFRYDRHLIENVKLCLADPEDAIKISQAGLDYLHENFSFYRNKEQMSFKDAMTNINSTFYTGILKGEKERTTKTYTVPYKDKQLQGAELLKQLDEWAKYGTIEPEARDAIAMVVKNPEWLDLSDKYFVLLGAGSAMGPLLVLLSLGANVIAVDLNRENIWKNLFTQTKNSPGTLYYPIRKPFEEYASEDEIVKSAGCNLFTEAPEIKNWLTTIVPNEPLIVGAYAYLDGPLHVKVSVAMDGIISALCNTRASPKGPGLTIAYLCTPTDVHVITDEAYEDEKKNYRNAPLWLKVLEKLGFIHKNQIPEIPGKNGKFKIVDGLVIQQGPNYTLAKRIQHWRAVVSRSRGIPVSSNVAPSTSTVSVVSNKSFAAAYGAMHFFKPMEIFFQQTSNAVMCALLLHDIFNPESVTNPKVKLANPFELFKIGSFHGGIWRTGFHFGELGFVSALLFYLRTYAKPLAFISISTIVALVSLLVQRGLPHNWF
uniref:very-long-chain (3R)-3-hydroxyacyl-CoA dehydratase n=1 Tax=Arcella intermedia TaxID=1963864 RepID=A0A6B2KYF3_9EUKA|eukprot:TRINITY_DN754_c0_g1_i1.p1 TRINITY_DN754_c0_g1~~TRINITY_DN754_c0_g1_i1.p1  ORF type:complete len:743 (+),score=110.36 TRINITY_DN754_c0_g1_i1:176-2404(+)